MYEHRISRIGWSVFLLICAAFVGGALWRLTLARPTLIRPPVAATLSPLAPQMEQRDQPPKADDPPVIGADAGHEKRAGSSQSNPTTTSPESRQRQDEILIVGDPMRIVLPHSQVERPLVVRAKPSRPVTFTAPDSGEFPNGEITITVKANEWGLAATTFSVTNEGEYRVLASSPENDGRAEFIVQCVTRKFRDDLDSGRYARQYFARERAANEQRTRAKARVEEQIRRKQSGQ